MVLTINLNLLTHAYKKKNVFSSLPYRYNIFYILYGYTYSLLKYKTYI